MISRGWLPSACRRVTPLPRFVGSNRASDTPSARAASRICSFGCSVRREDQRSARVAGAAYAFAISRLPSRERTRWDNFMDSPFNKTWEATCASRWKNLVVDAQAGGDIAARFGITLDFTAGGH